MRTWYRRFLGAASLWALGSLSGCGLVDSDSSSINLSPLEKQFTIDSTAWSVNNNAAVTLINQTCRPGAGLDPCAAAAATLVACKAATCTAQCNATTSKCELSLRVELWRAVNITTELPELVATGAPSMEDSLIVELDDLRYRISENALNVATPALNIYVAPATVMRATGEGVMRIAEIPAVPAITDLTPRSVTFMPGGKEVLRRRLADYQVPFNLIIASDLIVDDLTPIPSGRLSTSLLIRGSAGFQ